MKPKPPVPFATRLKQLRERAGMTRYRLAKTSGLNATHLGRLEIGEQQPSWEIVRKLARALDISVVEFE